MTASKAEIRAALVRLHRDIDTHEQMVGPDSPPDWFMLHYADLVVVLDYLETYMPIIRNR